MVHTFVLVGRFGCDDCCGFLCFLLVLMLWVFLADVFLLVDFGYEFAALFRGCGVCMVVVYYVGWWVSRGGVLYVWFGGFGRVGCLASLGLGIGFAVDFGY